MFEGKTIFGGRIAAVRGNDNSAIICELGPKGAMSKTISMAPETCREFAAWLVLGTKMEASDHNSFLAANGKQVTP